MDWRHKAAVMPLYISLTRQRRTAASFAHASGLRDAESDEALSSSEISRIGRRSPIHYKKQQPHSLRCHGSEACAAASGGGSYLLRGTGTQSGRIVHGGANQACAARLYADRVARRHRDHRSADRTAVASGAEGARGGRTHTV